MLQEASACQTMAKAQRPMTGKGKSPLVRKSRPRVQRVEALCFYCNQAGHFKKNCRKFQEDQKRNGGTGPSAGIYYTEVNLSTTRGWVLDTGSESHICVDMQVLESERRLAKGEADVRVADGRCVEAIAIGVVRLGLSSGLELTLNECYCIPDFRKDIISISLLDSEGFNFTIGNGLFNIFKDNIYYGSASRVKGLWILDPDSTDERGIYNVNTKRLRLNEPSETRLWHCRLGHISEKRLSTLHKCGLLSPSEFEPLDRCVSCLMGKMTRSPFTGRGERAGDLLGLIHTDVCGPMSTVARGGYPYFITFTDDHSRFGYVYLMRHKSDSFEKFKVFQNEVQNQLGKTIKALRSDRGGEYLTQPFIEHLESCGVISEWTPPGTPQMNGVSERRNRTLLDMVRSMMSQTELPISFWGYALLTAALILNKAPTKAVETTPYEVWWGKKPRCPT